LNILCTGARGFVGSHLVRGLERLGHRVIALQRPAAEAASAPAGRDVYQADLSSLKGIPDEIDAVVHAAATSPAAGVSATDIVRDNVLGTSNLIAAFECSRASRFIFLSSISLHGQVHDPEVNPATPRIQPDVYGASKHLCEEMVAERIPQGSVSIRLPGVVGLGARRNWLSSLLARMRSGGRISYFNPEASFNNAVHVSDLVEFIESLLRRDAEAFDAFPIGARTSSKVRDVVRQVAEHSGYRGELVVGEPKGSPFTISSQHAIERYDYSPMPLDLLLKRYVSEEMEGEVL